MYSIFAGHGSVEGNSARVRELERSVAELRETVESGGGGGGGGGGGTDPQTAVNTAGIAQNAAAIAQTIVNVSALDQSVTNNTANIAANTTAIANNVAAIATKYATADATAKHAAQDAAFAQHAASITNNATAIANNVAAIATKYATADADAKHAAQDAAFAQQATSITNNATAIANNVTAIATKYATADATAKHAAQDAAIAANTGNITSNATAIATKYATADATAKHALQDAAITANSTNITTNATAITVLNAKVGAMEYAATLPLAITTDAANFPTTSATWRLVLAFDGVHIQDAAGTDFIKIGSSVNGLGVDLMGQQILNAPLRIKTFSRATTQNPMLNGYRVYWDNSSLDPTVGWANLTGFNVELTPGHYSMTVRVRESYAIMQHNGNAIYCRAAIFHEGSSPSSADSIVPANSVGVGTPSVGVLAWDTDKQDQMCWHITADVWIPYTSVKQYYTVRRIIGQETKKNASDVVTSNKSSIIFGLDIGTTEPTWQIIKHS